MKHLFKMTRLSLIITLVVISGEFNFLNAQENITVQNDSLLIKSIGTWEGILEVESTELPVIFKIKKDEQQKFVVTLDSPSQNAFDIPVGGLSNEDGQLKIDVPSINGYYIGKYLNSSTLDGTWYQNGQSLPLKLVKKKDVK